MKNWGLKVVFSLSSQFFIKTILKEKTLWLQIPRSISQFPRISKIKLFPLLFFNFFFFADDLFQGYVLTIFLYTRFCFKYLYDFRDVIVKLWISDKCFNIFCVFVVVFFLLNSKNCSNKYLNFYRAKKMGKRSSCKWNHLKIIPNIFFMTLMLTVGDLNLWKKVSCSRFQFSAK